MLPVSRFEQATGHDKGYFILGVFCTHLVQIRTPLSQLQAQSSVLTRRGARCRKILIDH